LSESRHRFVEPILHGIATEGSVVRVAQAPAQADQAIANIAASSAQEEK
jgi:hypothetical protein